MEWMCRERVTHTNRLGKDAGYKVLLVPPSCRLPMQHPDLGYGILTSAVAPDA